MSAKIKIAQVIEGFLRDHSGESLRDAKQLAAIDLVLLAAHLHIESGRSEDHFLQLALGCLIEVQHGGSRQ